MPVCHKNRFIFFHIPKCAGTSIATHLGIKGKDSLTGLVSQGDKQITLHHLTPTDLKRFGFVDDEIIESYFKFTIVRDPFDRMVSDYLWQQRFDGHKLFAHISFNEYLDFAEQVISQNLYFEKRHFDHFRPMADYCINNGELLVDDILLLENLDQGLKRIKSKTGISDLPKLNRSNRQTKKYRTDEYIERVYKIYRSDKELYDRVRSLEQI